LPFRRLILLQLDFLPALLVGVVLLADGGERFFFLGEQRVCRVSSSVTELSSFSTAAGTGLVP
jgi:hypothetical protein